MFLTAYGGSLLGLYGVDRGQRGDADDGGGPATIPGEGRFPPEHEGRGMGVIVEIVGGETHEVALESGTYGDLLDAVGLSAQEAAVFVDDRPVPEDQPVETDHVRVVRLVSGG